jgi:lipopolysaccharide/colanic/teichoic acid biosynthesis glycosyltransferase
VTKRAFDLCVAGVALLLLAPVFVVVAVLVKLGSKGPVFFRQERIGRHFHPFIIYKFRTMTVAPAAAPIALGDESRVTRIGRLLRQAKIDEWPQLFNVLRGDMSLVGPRPEVRQFVDIFRDEYAGFSRCVRA